jgi:hypothetical protein
MSSKKMILAHFSSKSMPGCDLCMANLCRSLLSINFRLFSFYQSLSWRICLLVGKRACPTVAEDVTLVWPTVHKCCRSLLSINVRVFSVKSLSILLFVRIADAWACGRIVFKGPVDSLRGLSFFSFLFFSFLFLSFLPGLFFSHHCARERHALLDRKK